MILGAEIGLLVYGIVAMIRRKFSMGKRGYVTGWRAVVLGAMCAAVMPTILVIGLTVGVILAIQKIQVSPYSFVVIDICGLLFGFLSTTMLGRVYLAQQANEAASSAEMLPNPQSSNFDSSNPYAPTQMTSNSKS